MGCANPVLMDMLGVQCLSAAFSVLSALRGIAAMLGPPVAGVMVDMTGRTIITMDIAAGVMAGALVMSLITYLVDQVHRRREGYVQIE